MRWPAPLLEGRIVKRLNRFVVVIHLNGEEARAHLANSGRLGELLVAGRRCWAHPANREGRVTTHDLVLVESAQGFPVSVDARTPNRLFAELFRDNHPEVFSAFHHLESEVTVGASRLDFRLFGPTGIGYVEVKSVTLVEDGTALFPDAPTARGARHLDELIALRAAGHEAFAVFMVQRPDAVRFAPHDASDPTFGQKLREAHAAGVQIVAYACGVDLDGITVRHQILLVLPPFR